MKQNIALLIGLALVGCATVPTEPVSDETISFTLVQKDRKAVDGICRTVSPTGRIESHKACATGSHIILPGEPSETRHTVRVIRYERGPCTYACFRDGALHVETKAWQGHPAAVAGDALVEATGADVAFNRRWMLWHEFMHVEGFSHP